MHQPTKLLANCFERITDAFVALDTNWCFTYINKKAGEIFQRNPSELIGLHIWTEFPEGVDQSFYNAYHRAMAEQKYIHVEEYYLPYDKWFENHIYPSPEGLSVFFRDITDKKITEEKLAQSEKRFRALVENNEGIISLVDENLNVIFRSSSAARITGWTHDEFDKVNAQSNIHPEDLERVRTVMAKAHGNPGIAIPLELRVRHKNGHYLWLGGVVKNMMHEPAIAGIVTNMRDITEHKNAQEIIKANEQKLQLIYNTTADIIFLISVAGARYRFSSVNQSFLTSTGLKEEQVVGRFVDEVIPDPSLAQVLNNYQAAINSRKAVRWEETSNYPSGTKTGIVTITPVFDSEGVCNVLVGSVHDITDRIKVEKDLVENENYLRTILNTEPECVKVLNRKGELLSINPAGLAMIEAESEQQVRGHRMTELVEENYRLGFSRLSKEVFRGRSGTYEFEVKGLKGGRRWLETHAVPLKNAAGKIVNLLGVTRDITERKKAEEEIKNSTEQLRQLTAHLQNIREEERKRIGREIHDELGQQLTAIKMDVAWIDKKIPEATREAGEVSTIKTKLKNIISLLDGSNQSIRKILKELRAGVLDEYGMTDALEWQSRQFTETTGIAVKFKSPPSEIKLPQDMANCLFRVYQESLTNIMRHAKASKVLTSLTTKADHIVLSIKDNGNGFDLKSVQYRRSFGILGMRERVLSQNGKFELVSSKGKGTRIVVNLPYTS